MQISLTFRKTYPCPQYQKNLRKKLKAVDDAKSKSDIHLTFAIPKRDLLTCKKSNLLLEVLTVNHRLLMTMTVPFASRQAAFSVYKTLVVPPPQKAKEMRHGKEMGR